MKADFNWDDTRIFLAVARSGTLSGAAETMDMGIATLSRRLDRLEKSLAVLFQPASKRLPANG